MTHEELFEKFRSRKEVTQAKMFGWDGLFIHGNCFMALGKESFLVRLDEQGQALALKINGAVYFDPMKKGNPMKAWITIPFDSVDKHTEAVLEAAFKHVSAMPGKIKKKKK